MLVISSREFRQNQKQYFDKVDKGEQIIVQRGKDKSYRLTPITNDDMYFNKKMLARIKESILELDKSELKQVSTSKEISNLLGL
jgi:antitoxin YefM|tara:strand:+ start:417 stop:668 length:252 start_codon:yes stop_codon:yes gene_type:complete